MKRFCLLVPTLLVVLCAGSVHAASNDAHLEPLRKMLSREGVTIKATIYTDDMLATFGDRPTLGEVLDASARVTLTTLAVNEQVAVVRVEVDEPAGHMDMYAYVRHTGSMWKVSAMRQLNDIARAREVQVDLRQRVDLTPDDSLLQRQLTFVLASDAERMSLARAQTSAFEHVADLYAAGQQAQALEAARPLGVEIIQLRGNGQLDMIVGGLSGTVCGVIVIPYGTRPPNMSPDAYFYVEQAAPRVFVFKGSDEPR